MDEDRDEPWSACSQFVSALGRAPSRHPIAPSIVACESCGDGVAGGARLHTEHGDAHSFKA
jgi:hypothetical protein